MKKVVATREPEFDEGLLNSLLQAKLVGIHGRCGASKTELSKELVSLVGGTHIQVDDFLSTPANGRTYLEQLKRDELILKIRSSATPVLLDCYLVLDVLEKINMRADYLIFCDRVIPHIRFNPEREAEFDLYEERWNPMASANKTFTFRVWLEDA